MERSGPRRSWIKLHINGWLNGSVRYQLTGDERSVWVDLLAFGSLCIEPGLISDNDKRPYPHSFLANRFNVPIELFERTMTKCEQEGRIKEDTEGIRLVNWRHYQSDYQRQRPYRGKP